MYPEHTNSVARGILCYEHVHCTTCACVCLLAMVVVNEGLEQPEANSMALHPLQRL